HKECGVRPDTLAGRLIVGEQGSHRPRAFLAGETNAVKRINNATGEHQVDGRREISGVLLKKRSLLGKENLESLVDSDLRFVGLHLAEIRIDSCVQDEAVLQKHLGVETCFSLDVLGIDMEGGRSP